MKILLTTILTYRIYLPVFFLLLMIPDRGISQITVGSLLQEMTNREHITKFPVPAYTCAQASSYDRHSTEVNGDLWFANWDRSYWLRTEMNEGRREFVMMDTEGPGAVVRFWVTVAAYGGKGTLRIYLDNNEEPTIEGDVFDIISGNALTKYPLSASVSEKIDYLRRGHNLYLPIPYSEHCKVTYESDAVTNEPGAQKGEALYYNINYRTYEEGTKVKSFSKNDLAEYADIIENANEALTNTNEDISDLEHIMLDGTISPGQEISKNISGNKAIRRLELKISAENFEQALRSTVLEIAFDGEETVWCPVGDFFGTGYKLSPFNSFYCSVLNDGTLISNWVMPFKSSCKIKIHNYGEQKVEISNSKIYTADYDWDELSMHFGAGWFEANKLYTGDGPRSMEGKSDNFFDMNYVTLQGKGVLVGTGLTLFNTKPNWWGEGDEKVYVDNEAFPSHFGTGTEDYFGYAWCRGEKFSHPFITQPDGSGNLTVGHSVNQRYRGLDGIPFTQNLKFDMEIWHSVSTTINYAPVSMWYMLPGGKTNRGAVPELVKNKVILDKSDFFSRAPDENGRIESEFMKADCSTGEIREQSTAQFNWSNESQVWWTGGNIGCSATLTFEVENDAMYNLHASLTKAVDYGIVDIKIDGKDALKKTDAYCANGVANEVVSLGQHQLAKGEHTLEVIITGANPSAIKKYMFGIDYIDVIQLSTRIGSD